MGNLSAEMDHVVVSSGMWEDVFVTPTSSFNYADPKGARSGQAFPVGRLNAVEITPKSFVWQLDERSWIVLSISKSYYIPTVTQWQAVQPEGPTYL